MGELLGIPGLSRSVELKLLDLLTSQLNRELISQNMTMAGLMKRADGVLQKRRELLEASASLRGEKVDLEEKLLSQLLKLQKMLEEVSSLQEKLAPAQSEISSFREHIERGCSNKLALECEVCVLWGNLESCDKDVKKLRAEISRQSDRCNDIWLVHKASLEEMQKLHSEVISLRSNVQVESARGWLRGENRNPEGLASGPVGRVVSPRDRSVVLKALAAGMRDLRGSQQIGTVAVGGDSGANPLLYG